MDQGGRIVRPSSKGMDLLTVTWKVADASVNAMAFTNTSTSVRRVRRTRSASANLSDSRPHWTGQSDESFVSRVAMKAHLHISSPGAPGELQVNGMFAVSKPPIANDKNAAHIRRSRVKSRASSRALPWSQSVASVPSCDRKSDQYSFELAVQWRWFTIDIGNGGLAFVPVRQKAHGPRFWSIFWVPFRRMGAPVCGEICNVLGRFSRRPLDYNWF